MDGNTEGLLGSTLNCFIYFADMSLIISYSCSQRSETYLFFDVIIFVIFPMFSPLRCG